MNEGIREELAALSGKVKLQNESLPPIVRDSHMHTPMSMHAKGWPHRYVETALQYNLAGVCFTEHAPLPESFLNIQINGGRSCLDLRVFEEYFLLIDKTKERYNGRLEVRLGIEVDYIPTDVEHLRLIIKKTEDAGGDYILGSVHCLKKALIEDYFNNGNILEGQKLYYRQMADAAGSGFFDCIAHPDLIKCRYTKDYWLPQRLEKEIGIFLDALKETDTCMELNTAGFNREPYYEMFPCDYILKMAHKKGVPIVLGSDAHSQDRVGANFKEALGKLASIGYEEVYYYDKRERQSYSIRDALRSLP